MNDGAYIFVKANEEELWYPKTGLIYNYIDTEYYKNIKKTIDLSIKIEKEEIYKDEDLFYKIICVDKNRFFYDVVAGNYKVRRNSFGQYSWIEVLKYKTRHDFKGQTLPYDFNNLTCNSCGLHFYSGFNGHKRYGESILDGCGTGCVNIDYMQNDFICSECAGSFYRAENSLSLFWDYKNAKFINIFRNEDYNNMNISIFLKNKINYQKEKRKNEFKEYENNKLKGFKAEWGFSL